MKSFAVAACVLALAVVAVSAQMSPMIGSSYGGGAPAPSSSYGSAPTIPAPKCANNYLFSCQPSLSPAPCAPAPASYGSSGAYSENHPVYVNYPQYGY